MTHVHANIKNFGEICIHNVSSFCKLFKTYLFGRIPALRAPLSRFLEGALYKYPE